jgi:hypothetical protein
MHICMHSGELATCKCMNAGEFMASMFIHSQHAYACIGGNRVHMHLFGKGLGMKLHRICTGNILVHLLPALLLIGALLTGNLPQWPLARIAFVETVAPILICLCGSVLYHTLMANHWHYRKYLFVDVRSPSSCHRNVTVLLR